MGQGVARARAAVRSAAASAPPAERGVAGRRAMAVEAVAREAAAAEAGEMGAEGGEVVAVGAAAAVAAARVVVAGRGLRKIQTHRLHGSCRRL